MAKALKQENYLISLLKNEGLTKLEKNKNTLKKSLKMSLIKEALTLKLSH